MFKGWPWAQINRNSQTSQAQNKHSAPTLFPIDTIIWKWFANEHYHKEKSHHMAPWTTAITSNTAMETVKSLNTSVSNNITNARNNILPDPKHLYYHRPAYGWHTHSKTIQACKTTKTTHTPSSNPANHHTIHLWIQTSSSHSIPPTLCWCQWHHLGWNPEQNGSI